MVRKIIGKYEKHKSSDGAYHASTRLTRGPSVAARSEVSGKYSNRYFENQNNYDQYSLIVSAQKKLTERKKEGLTSEC